MDIGAGGSVVVDADVVAAETLVLELLLLLAAVRLTGRRVTPKISSSLEWVSKVCSSRSSSHAKSDTHLPLSLSWAADLSPGSGTREAAGECVATEVAGDVDTGGDAAVEGGGDEDTVEVEDVDPTVGA